MITDHRPLVYALHPVSKRYSLRGIRHFDFVSKFAVGSRHTPGADSSVTDVLSHMHSFSLSQTLSTDLDAMMQAMATDPDVGQLRQDSSLNLSFASIAVTKYNSL